MIISNRYKYSLIQIFVHSTLGLLLLLTLSSLVLTLSSLALAQSTISGVSAEPQKSLTVLTKRIEPFVSYENDQFSGFSIELWQKIAEHQNLKFEFKMEPSLTSLLEGMYEARADVAIAAITITAEREAKIDFSHPYFSSGLSILTNNNNSSAFSQIWEIISSIFLSKTFAIAGILLLGTLLVVSHIIWLLERHKNPHFSKAYIPGLWDSFWWAMVTLATVGYGDKAPVAVFGRLFAMFWMIVGYFMFAYFTASVTSFVTIRELRGTINGPDDLPGHKVAVISKSSSDKYMDRYSRNVKIVRVEKIEKAYELLSKAKVDAVVHDSPVLLYYVQRKGEGKFKVAGQPFHEEDYGIVFPNGSTLREPINRAILQLVENGEYAKIYNKWFGQ